MNFEDVNSLYEKYKYLSFWYELSYDDIVDNITSTSSSNPDRIDFIEGYISNGNYYLNICNALFNGQFYNARSTNPSSKTGGIQGYIDVDGELFSSFGITSKQSLYFNIIIDKEYRYSRPIIAEFKLITPFVYLKDSGVKKIYIDDIYHYQN